MRQRVACGTCARVDWIDNVFPCYLFAECPDNVKAKASQSDDKCDSNEDNSSEDQSSEEEEGVTHSRHGKILRDANGYYVINAYAINQLLCLLYTSPSPRDQRGSRMPSSA